MTFWEKLFNFKFVWLKNLFNSMEKIWEHLGADEQAASLKASGYIAIINANLGQVPDVVFKLIQEKFPNVTPESVQADLIKAGTYLKIADGVATMSLEDAIKAFQTHLSSVTGNDWVATTQHAVAALLNVLLPSTTPLQKITTILEFVYDNFVKGKIA